MKHDNDGVYSWERKFALVRGQGSRLDEILTRGTRTLLQLALAVSSQNRERDLVVVHLLIEYLEVDLIYLASQPRYQMAAASAPVIDLARLLAPSPASQQASRNEAKGSAQESTSVNKESPLDQSRLKRDPSLLAAPGAKMRKVGMRTGAHPLKRNHSLAQSIQNSPNHRNKNNMSIDIKSI